MERGKKEMCDRKCGKVQSFPDISVARALCLKSMFLQSFYNIIIIHSKIANGIGVYNHTVKQESVKQEKLEEKTWVL